MRKQSTCYHAFKDWNNLDVGLGNLCTISDLKCKFEMEIISFSFFFNFVTDTEQDLSVYH